VDTIGWQNSLTLTGGANGPVTGSGVSFNPISKNIVSVINSKFGTKIITQQINFPLLNTNDLLKDFEDIIIKNKNIKLIIIDHITAATALIMPIKEMIIIAHKYNKKILIDGAHSVGTLDLNIELLKPDWYVGCLHKWFFTMKSVGFLYSNKINQSFTKNIIISHSYKDDYMHNFFMNGTEDQSNYLSIIKSFNFIERIGGIQNIIKYNKSLLLEGVKLCIDKLKTSILIPLELCPSNMISIILPLNDSKVINKLGEVDTRIKLINLILKNYKIDTIIFIIDYNKENVICTRLSCQIYNTIDDYIKYSDAILDLKIKMEF
jgi:selenocysteine lyase/cysteine desulfurase